MVLVAIGLLIAALIRYGAIKPTAAKGAVDRLSGGYVTDTRLLNLLNLFIA